MASNTKVIACDGPARAGKTTLADNFEKRLGIPRLSTGNIYRSLALLSLETLKINNLDEVDEEEIERTIFKHDIDALKVNFSGEVFYDDNLFTGLNAPRVAAGAKTVSHLKRVRSDIVEPLVKQMVEECEHPLVFSEGRDEGRIWKDANRLGIAIFLSVDPLVGAMRERMVRTLQRQEVPPLRELMNTLMRYDLDNASRKSRPTYIDDEAVVYTGKITKEIKRALADKQQIIVPTSSIDAVHVFQRVVRLADAAGLFEDKNIKLQTSLLEL